MRRPPRLLVGGSCARACCARTRDRRRDRGRAAGGAPSGRMRDGGGRRGKRHAVAWPMTDRQGAPDARDDQAGAGRRLRGRPSPAGGEVVADTLAGRAGLPASWWRSTTTRCLGDRRSVAVETGRPVPVGRRAGQRQRSTVGWAPSWCQAAGIEQILKTARTSRAWPGQPAHVGSTMEERGATGSFDPETTLTPCEPALRASRDAGPEAA